MPRNIAVLWDKEVEWGGEKPFAENHVNTTYEYISELAAEKDHKIFIARFNWYSEGDLEKAYIFDGENWSKVENIRVDTVLDKYKFDQDTIELKQEIEERHPVLNSFKLERICKDKIQAYKRFPELHPETREATRENVEGMLEKYNKVVLKPVAAHAGEGVEIIQDISEFNEAEGMIVQQFIDSSTGIGELGIDGVHDLRVVVVDGEPVLSYVRQPESGLVSNVAQGGSMEFIELAEVPLDAMKIVDKVVEVFDQQGSFVCGVDMIFDEDQKPWILELNSKPGMSYYKDGEIKEWKDSYIRAVVDSISEIS